MVIVAVVALRAWQRRDLPTGQAPPLHGQDLSGAEVALAAEEPTLVHFWASWCVVCRAMDHNIAAVAEDHRVVTVAVQSGPSSAVANWMREHGLVESGAPAFPVVADPRSELARRWGVKAFPTTFVVDPQGHIRFVEVGYSSELGLRARLWLAGH